MSEPQTLVILQEEVKALGREIVQQKGLVSKENANARVTATVQASLNASY